MKKTRSCSRRKAAVWAVACLAAASVLAGCGQAGGTSGGTAKTEVQQSTEGTTSGADAQQNGGQPAESTTILVAAAASLKNSFDERLIPMFEEANPDIRVEGTYDSSGKLQTQIEEGLEADLFLSAAMKQMNALKDEQLIDADSIVELLENKVVLIVPAGTEPKVSGFADITEADMIAVGDPESVPAGQYAKEALTSLSLWEAVEEKASLGTNVTEVLNWVAAGSADAGIVYATDAASTDKVQVIAEAPEGSLKTKVIYPVGIVSASGKKEAAGRFMEFLQSPEALAVFEEYGFSAN